ncbi:unnamed protein product [Chrysodeixis includens]|uniref:GST N-terminal domain-containing protein n=1 Tax=Chrysodeixis includens TaxID=689277 RepID=A0A9N8PXE6_CHRIL|nr:unnamed protein product [Chrysodeixis includens]
MEEPSVCAADSLGKNAGAIPTVDRIAIVAQLSMEVFTVCAADSLRMDASPPARAAMMVINILGLDFDLQNLNPVLREQDAPEFKKKNPMRTIPILDEGDFSMADRRQPTCKE